MQKFQFHILSFQSFFDSIMIIEKKIKFIIFIVVSLKNLILRLVWTSCKVTVPLEHYDSKLI